MSTLVLPISGLPWGHLKNKNWLISSHLRGLGGGHNICYVWGDFCCDFCIRSCRWGQAPCPPLAPSWPQSQASLLTGLTCEGWLTFVLIFFLLPLSFSQVFLSLTYFLWIQGRQQQLQLVPVQTSVNIKLECLAKCSCCRKILKATHPPKIG